MGRRAREKKLAKIETEALERTLIAERKREQMRSFYSYLRRITATVAVTIFLLWLGVFVEEHIGSIVSNIVGRG
ncbi:MAG: hypothetical protein HZB70_03905 [Candidatus Berkelbacteria bacterium]|nr:MAG: hypothetical protein HZB70_03905 [Candidatus Berkelbacteria bacterium]QQG51556.1 MAG: hypothetical protein HY845_03285 [Candidatus Berkelbacteria bacterium]